MMPMQAAIEASVERAVEQGLRREWSNVAR